MAVKIKTKQDAFIFEYPEAIAFSDMQNSVFWPATEIEVEKDIQDIKVNMTDSEQHGVLTVLRLFTKYEQFAGNEYWGGRVKRTYPRPCIETMATTFSFFEVSIHARFYNMLNEALNINTEDFYNDYVNDPVLKERMDFISDYINNKDDELSIAVFSLVEGVVLYSSFAFLKHFQSEGKNKLVNVDAGISFSVRDENIHSEAGAWLFKQSCKEEGRLDDEGLKQKIYDAAQKLYEHECKIIEMIFEKGKIKGITDVQLKHFVESRINLCLVNLGLSPMFKVDYNPIAKWFYRDINAVNFHDFFVKVGNSYNRSWNESRFVW